MLNEVKHLYNKDSSLTLRMTVSVIIYIVTFFYVEFTVKCPTIVVMKDLFHFKRFLFGLKHRFLKKKR